MTISACFAMLIVSCKKNETNSDSANSGGNGSSGGHEYVDLGLPSGLRWATCNIGATAPEEYGFYYAWGETGTKGVYNESSYLWFDQGQGIYTKYTWEGNVIVLESADDAATINWGGNWRMPTRDEFAELQSNCNWSWTTQNNINGWIVKGSNGNSIFLPATGAYYGNGVSYVNEFGHYWSSSLSKVHYSYEDEQNEYAHSLGFDENSFGCGFSTRFYGQSVRPVYSGKPSVSTAEVSEVSYYSATCGGYVSSGTSSVKARGICWSNSQNPTLNDAHTEEGTGNGSFTSNITGLTPNTKYFVRAYATNDAGTSYGLQVSFNTKATTSPTVDTDTIIEYTETGVVVVGSVIYDGGLEITERGFCWNTENEPTIDNNKVSCGSGMGSFEKEISGLEANKKYYTRAYATNSKGTSYGSELVFEMGSGVITGHPYTDLGLPSGTLWATCNVGAAFPEGYGDCYAWGEIETKVNYNWSNYKWCNGYSNLITKYCTNSSYGTVDGLYQLEPEDDVASVKWGGSWHMPTYNEMRELVDLCQMTYEMRNNVMGLLFTGPNGRSIFMPVNNEYTYYGQYWVNEICDYYSYQAKCTGFEYQWCIASIYEEVRCCGYQVRPVSTPRSKLHAPN